MSVQEPTSRSSPFALGAVIFPASDSLLSQLGVDIEKEGTRCLGLVVEDRNNKSKVYFPQLDMSLWLDHNEMKDVSLENQTGNASFYGLAPTANSTMAKHPAWIGKWWIDQLEPIEILETQTDTIESLWSLDDGPLTEHYTGDVNQRIFKLSLGIEELDLTQWKSLENLHGDSLALARFLPAGMYKLEVQLFLKCSTN